VSNDPWDRPYLTPPFDWQNEAETVRELPPPLYVPDEADEAELPPPPEEPPTLRGLEPFELLDVEALSRLPEPEWQNGIWHKGSFVVVFGAAASGKTFWVLDAALSIASGRAAVSGPVVYVAGEGRLGLAQRVAGWQARHRGADPAEHGFHVLPEAVRLLDDHAQDRLVTTLERLDPAPSLVVVDTWARSFSGGNENDAQDVAKVVEFLDRIRAKLGCTVLVVHHSSKEGHDERGSTALRGAADTMVKITCDGPIRTVYCSKQKDAEEFNPYTFRLETARYGPSPAVTPSLVTAQAGSAPASQGVF